MNPRKLYTNALAAIRYLRIGNDRYKNFLLISIHYIINTARKKEEKIVKMRITIFLSSAILRRHCSLRSRVYSTGTPSLYTYNRFASRCINSNLTTEKNSASRAFYVVEIPTIFLVPYGKDGSKNSPNAKVIF